MSILRNRTKDGYTVITNNIFRDERLPLNARGLLCTMFSLPDGWDFSEQGLAKILPNGITAIRTALKILIDCGYVKRTQIREGGRIVDWAWEVTNISGNFSEEPVLENPKMETPKLVTGIQLNTKEVSTNESNKKKEKGAKAPKEKRKRFTPPTIQEVSEYISQMGYGLDPQEFMDANEQSGWRLKSGQPVKNWKARVRTFERNRKKWGNGQNKSDRAIVSDNFVPEGWS